MTTQFTNLKAILAVSFVCGVVQAGDIVIRLPGRAPILLQTVDQRLHLVTRSPKIQKELNLSGDQRHKLFELYEKVWEQLREVRKMERKYWKDGYQRVNRQTDKQVRAILSKGQDYRLDQLLFQKRASYSIIYAVLYPPFSETLYVTAYQSGQIRRLQFEQTQAYRQLPKDLCEDERRRAMRKIRKQTDARVLSFVLTESQRLIVKRLMHKPFDFSKP